MIHQHCWVAYWFESITSKHFESTVALGVPDKSLINNIDGEDGCDVLEEGYMRAEQDVTEHPLGVQVNECY